MRFRYYVLLALVLTAVNTAAGVVKYAATIKSDLTETAKEVVQNFPPDLELVISPNGITANKNFPLVAKTPSPLKDLPENLLVIDPNGQVGMLQEYNALMLVNNSYLIVGSGDGVQTTPLKDFPEVRVNYASMQDLAQKLLFVAGSAHLFTAGFFALNNLFDFFVARLLYLAAFAFVLRLIYILRSKIEETAASTTVPHKSVLVRYWEAFVISVCSITPPLLIDTTLGIAGVKIPFFGWFVFVHIIFTLYLVRRLEKPANRRLGFSHRM